MINKYRPDMYYPSFKDINLDLLKNKGIKVVLCDLDNTLVPNDVEYPADEHFEFVKRVEENDLKFVIISNNKEKRVGKFAKELNVDYICGAKKPLKFAFNKVFNKYQVSPSEVVLIGDQIMTDVLGANRSQVTSILIDQIVIKDIFYTRINRIWENIVLKKMMKKEMFEKGSYYE